LTSKTHVVFPQRFFRRLLFYVYPLYILNFQTFP